MSTFGLEKDQWQLLSKIALKPLMNNDAKLWVFGSRAVGKQKKFSDIDILIETKRELPPELLPIIRATLEESDLTIKVDLVLVEDLADSYRKNVDAQKVQIII